MFWQVARSSSSSDSRGSAARKTTKKASKRPAKAKKSKAAVGSTDPSPRRRPTQARSQRRFESIVEAAAESFAQFGFTDTTMEGIAARAGTSIGSVYQFFPNKHALFREIADRCIQLSRDSYTELLGPAPFAQPWDQVLDRCIDGFVKLHRERTVMRAIWRNLELYGEFAEADQALMRELVEATAMLFLAWGPKLPLERRQVIASVLVNTFVAAMLMLSREEGSGREEDMLNEVKAMLRGYLGMYFDG